MFYSFIKILYVSMYFDKEYRFFRLAIKCPQQMSIQFAIEKKKSILHIGFYPSKQTCPQRLYSFVGHNPEALSLKLWSFFFNLYNVSFIIISIWFHFVTLKAHTFLTFLTQPISPNTA